MTFLLPLLTFHKHLKLLIIAGSWLLSQTTVLHTHFGTHLIGDTAGLNHSQCSPECLKVVSCLHCHLCSVLSLWMTDYPEMCALWNTVCWRLDLKKKPRWANCLVAHDLPLIQWLVGGKITLWLQTAKNTNDMIISFRVEEDRLGPHILEVF